MAIGDVTDFVSRFRRLLPASWWPHDDSQRAVLDALLKGYATQSAYIYDLIDELKTQARINTATGGTLDLASYDFFADAVPRLGADDSSFRRTIKNELLLSRNTRKAVRTAVQKQMGIVPIIIEPTIPGDTGAYASSLVGATQNPSLIQYGNLGATDRSTVQGGKGGYYGSVDMPAQFLLLVKYATSSSAYGSPNGGGYEKASRTSWASASGYYSVTVTTQPGGSTPLLPGKGLYSSGLFNYGYATAAELLGAINRTKAAGTTAWFRYI
jgi:hypothetical protein